MSVVDEAIVGRLEALVGIETPSGHTAGILAAFELLRGWLAPSLGSPGEIVVGEGVPHLLWAPPRGAHTLLLGHVDTVWPLGTASARPFAVDGGRATGPGVLDMKSGLVIGAAALELAGDATGVAVLVTGDEEAGSPTSRALIERVAGACGSVLVLEPSSEGALKTARKGVGQYRIEITGRAAHAGLAPRDGVNALSELARLVPAIEDLADDAQETTVTPTVAHAGSVANVVPAKAELEVDVRAWTAGELRRVDGALRRLSTRDGVAAIRVHGTINRYALEPHHSGPLVRQARAVAARLGLGPLHEARVGGASDGNFTAALGVSTLDGLGASGGGAHEEREWVELDSLSSRARLVAGLLDALGG